MESLVRLASSNRGEQTPALGGRGDDKLQIVLVAFIEYDLALINADHGSKLVIEEFFALRCLRFFVNRLPARSSLSRTH